MPLREIAVVREISKMYEECISGSIAEVRQQLAEHPVKGEIVLIIAPPADNEQASPDIEELLREELEHSTVKEAVKKPRKIDLNLTDAQQARRVLDRIVGYKISPVLWKKVKRGLSAGRVQSVAVKLICDREEEIEHFVPEEYWNITAILSEPKTKKIF